MKRVMIISDLHCGHRAGLTPPAWQFALDPEEPKRHKWAEQQRECWDVYTERVKKWQPVDVLIVNGDAVDGKGERSGGTEMITSDRNEQAQMAARCIQEVGAPIIRMTYGTPYHTGVSEDFEEAVAQMVGAEITSHGYYEIEGFVFDVKHFISSSIIPYGRHTSLSRDKMWDLIWQEGYGGKKADITIRSHVHYMVMNYDTPLKLGIITPALCGLGGKYGSRICQGWVDFGITVIDCEKDKGLSPVFETVVINKKALKPELIENES